MMTGAVPYEQLSATIDSLLNAPAPAPPAP
jgi:hypothetical protein